MTRRMAALGLSICLLPATGSMAQQARPAAVAPAPAPLPPPVATQGRQFSAQAGTDDGGLILGANFDFMDTASENYGAYARLYSKDKNKNQPALFALGANFRGHARHGLFDYYIAPGFGMIHYNLNKTELLFGPTLAFGLTVDLDKWMALGIEDSKLFSWVGEYKGLIKDSFLATFRYQLH